MDDVRQPNPWDDFRPENSESECSAAVKEIMGRSPAWIVRWGITLLALLVGSLLFISWLIRYPDTIDSPIVVTGLNPPVGVMARNSGHLETLLVEERQEVSRNQILGIIEGPGPGAARRLLPLKAKLEVLTPFMTNAGEFEELDLDPEVNLGTLQSSYGAFLSAYESYLTALKDDYTSVTLGNLNARLLQKSGQVEHAQEEARAVARELELAEAQAGRMQLLLERDSISLTRFQEAEEERLAKQRLYAAVKSQALEEEIALSVYRQEILDLEHDRAETLRGLRSVLRDALKKLFAEIEVWEAQYVLRAPVDGTVAFYDFWADQQYVQAGKEVFIIVPSASTLVGRMSVTDGGTGKIQSGQSVRVRFADYPHKQFGIVFGRVKSVSLVPRQGVHQVSVDLEYPLRTNYNRELLFKQDMTGEASIITEDIRLISRVFYEIRKVLIDILPT